MMHSIKILVALLAIASTAHAQFSTPILFNNGSRVSPAFPQWNLVGAVAGDVSCVGANQFITCTFKGGGSATTNLQQAYSNSAGAPTPLITLTSAIGPLTIFDNAVPLGGDLFTVENNGATSKYFDVSATGVSVLAGGTTNYLTIDSTAAHNAIALLIKNGGVNVLEFFSGGGTTLNELEFFRGDNGVFEIGLQSTPSQFMIDTLSSTATLTSSDALTISSAAAKALTLTSNAAATWSTSAGALSVDAATALNLGNTNATGVNISRTGVIANLNWATVATGGGSNALLGTVGGSGPTTAAMNAWLPISIGGTAGYFISVWR